MSIETWEGAPVSSLPSRVSRGLSIGGKRGEQNNKTKCKRLPYLTCTLPCPAADHLHRSADFAARRRSAASSSIIIRRTNMFNVGHRRAFPVASARFSVACHIREHYPRSQKTTQCSPIHSVLPSLHPTLYIGQCPCSDSSFRTL